MGVRKAGSSIVLGLALVSIDSLACNSFGASVLDLGIEVDVRSIVPSRLGGLETGGDTAALPLGLPDGEVVAF